LLNVLLQIANKLGLYKKKKVLDIVEIRHQATTGEDTADLEDLVCAVVNCRVSELEIAF
jgi:hypothetical protein